METSFGWHFCFGALASSVLALPSHIWPKCCGAAARVRWYKQPASSTHTLSKSRGHRSMSQPSKRLREDQIEGEPELTLTPEEADRLMAEPLDFLTELLQSALDGARIAAAATACHTCA